MPFQAVGYPITGLFEKNETPYAHTINDVIDNLDLNYLYEVVKGSLATLLHFSEAKQQLNTIDIKNEIVKLYPNPIKDIVYFSEPIVNTTVEIVNQNGQIVFSEYLSKSTSRLNLKQLKKGVYYVNLKSNTSQNQYKLIKK